MEAIGLLGVFALLLIYLSPVVVALWRGHPQVVAIGLLNLFLGWTAVGWVVSLVWSAAAISRPESAVPGATRRAMLFVLLGVSLFALGFHLVVSMLRTSRASSPIEKSELWRPRNDEMRFQTWWKSDTTMVSFLPIARTLVERNQHGCGSISWADSIEYDNVYLVACIGRSDTPSYYIIRTDTKQVFAANPQAMPQRPQCHPWQNDRCLAASRAQPPAAK